MYNIWFRINIEMLEQILSKVKASKALKQVIGNQHWVTYIWE